MKLTNLLTFSLFTITSAACASNDGGQDGASGAQPDRAQARRAFASASVAIETAFAQLDNQPGIAPFNGTVDLSAPCALSGTIDLDGTYDASASDTAIDLQASFNACAEEEGTLDGTLHWVSAISGTHSEDHWTGTLMLDVPPGLFSCAFDLHAVTDDGDVTYSGTICGYDVSADLGL